MQSADTKRLERRSQKGVRGNFPRMPQTESQKAGSDVCSRAIVFGVRLCPGLLFQRAVKARDWDAVTFTIRWGQRRHERRDWDEVSFLSHPMM